MPSGEDEESGNLDSMKHSSLIDRFVESVNAGEREAQETDVTPEFLRIGGAGEWATDWKIVRSDNAVWVEKLESRLSRRLPRSFRYFIANYCFPSFDTGGVTLLANTGQDGERELGTRMISGGRMASVLSAAGYVQFGNPDCGSYDPVCFDLNRWQGEQPIVRLDHEAALQFGRVVVEAVAPSFIDFIRGCLDKGAGE